MPLRKLPPEATMDSCDKRIIHACWNRFDMRRQGEVDYHYAEHGPV